VILGVDVGGTFTDAVLVTPHRVFSAKTLSTDPQSEGVLAAARAVLGRARVAPAEVDRFVHGMTVATNALLERRGARTVLLTTEGFRDLLTIGRQERLHLYTLFPERTPPLVAREDCVTVGERAGPAGVEKPLLAAEVERVVRLVAACAPEAVAVCLLWSFRHPEHEQRLAAALRAALPEVPVVCSAEVAPLFREFERMSTAVLDAYVTPRTGRYLERLTEGCLAAGLPMPEIMTSSGGTSPYEQARRHGARLLLSGPAGGVRAGAALARGLGYERVLTFDMGGTSTDVAHFSDEFERAFETEVAGVRLRAPMMEVHTVAAGGGSVLHADPGRFRVGPDSAGADPGPACYRRGGPLTVTDANFEDTVQRSPVPVLMEFWSPYCLYCQRLEPTMRKLAGEVSDRVRVAKLNIDENRITAARYGVHATPTVAMIDQGRLMDKVEGAVPEEQLRYRFHRFLS